MARRANANERVPFAGRIISNHITLNNNLPSTRVGRAQIGASGVDDNNLPSTRVGRAQIGASEVVDDNNLPSTRTLVKKNLSSHNVADIFEKTNRNNCTEISIEKMEGNAVISFKIDQTTLKTEGLIMLNPNHAQYKPYRVFELDISDSSNIIPSFSHFGGYFQNVIDEAIRNSLGSTNPITNVKFALDDYNEFTDQFSTIKFIKGKLVIYDGEAFNGAGRKPYGW